MTAKVENKKKTVRSQFQQHISSLIWKFYTQRQRRWRLLLAETIFALILFLIAVHLAKPVFLTPLQDEPEPPLASAKILAALHKATTVGYAPNEEPYNSVMFRAAELLNTSFMSASTYNDLNIQLYKNSTRRKINKKIIWVIFESKDDGFWKFSIRSTDVARYARRKGSSRNLHLRAGFLAVQLAVSTSILETVSGEHPRYEMKLVSMPVSPLMEKEEVRKVISLVLLCFTLAMLPPVLETEAMVVTESLNQFKRALRMRHVSYSSMYLGWLMYMFLTALPVCLLGSITLILIFRWIHLVYALLTLLAYITIMTMLALIMAMFHNKAYIACIWSIMGTLMQTFLAELMVHHKYDSNHGVITFLLHMFLPPLGLVHGLNQFALLQIGHGGDTDSNSLIYTIVSWVVMIFVYFQLLMLLQRTIGQDRAIGGQVSWKAIIFKQAEDIDKLHHIVMPTGRERQKLQEVDELLAKAVSFSNVSKSILDVHMLTNVTFDIYRGELTTLYTERIQEKMMNTIEDLLVGLTYADSGTINVLGVDLNQHSSCMTDPYMMGYCHHSKFLVDDLTVREHIDFFAEISMWKESGQYVFEYTHLRATRLLAECDLIDVRDQYVKDLDVYYRAQLCWAIAMLMEPRIVVLPNFADHPTYMAVIIDKIMKYKKYLTILKISYSSINLEYADRVFLFDNKIVSFGGTPAYMFFKFGREYRLRITFRSDTIQDDAYAEALIEKAQTAGATVRAHLGSLLILRLPASPTEQVAALIKDLTENNDKYGITSMNITLPDSEEVCHRAVSESRSESMLESTKREVSSKALKRIASHEKWERMNLCNSHISHLRCIGRKYVSFYKHYRFFFIITMIAAIVAGVFLGLSISSLVTTLAREHDVNKIIYGEVLTVEALEQNTVLVLRLDKSARAKSVAEAYVLSQTNASKKGIDKMVYTAIARPESLTEYLVTRAIDSPQHYVYMYAYGLDVSSGKYGNLIIQALYSPLHNDHAAAARSMARAHMALIRHYTGQLDASIEITDNPLTLDETPGMKEASTPSILIQFLLVLTISHITLIPSQEHGLIRHMQSHSLNFSPLRYWLTLYFYDLILYWLLVAVMTFVSGTIIYLIVPFKHFYYKDLLVVPFTLIVYGLGCVPQAYLFGLGPRPALSSMAFIMFNIVFGETTILAKLLYGSMYNYALNFMALSPQFNMAYALVKIKKIYLYNSECIIFKAKNLCSSKTLHKCCKKCGVLQKCFKKQYYLSRSPGILMELIATVSTGLIFLTLLLLWEYRVIQRIWNYVMWKVHSHEPPIEKEMMGVTKEKSDVIDKMMQIRMTNCQKVDTFGEYLLAANVCKKEDGVFTVRNVYLGLGKGEALALSGLKRHGRLKLSKMLAGYILPSDGSIWSMSKWKLSMQPHMFGRQIALCCELDPVPQWMTVHDSLELIGTLRGVPNKHLTIELRDYIEALELTDQADILVCRLLPSEKKRLNFAAAVIGAPPIIVIDECTAYQKYSARRAMYFILHHLRRRGHAIFISSHSVESHMPVTNRLAIIMDGKLYDIDTVDNLLERYGNRGFTVVVHLKDEVDVNAMFAAYFQRFLINDTSDVLVNVQVLDDLDWMNIFEKMEHLKADNYQVYSYIVSAVPIDYIYNNILSKERGLKEAPGVFSWPKVKKLLSHKAKIKPGKEKLRDLMPFEKKYGITTLKELPWSVIFQR